VTVSVRSGREVSSAMRERSQPSRAAFIPEALAASAPPETVPRSCHSVPDGGRGHGFSRSQPASLVHHSATARQRAAGRCRPHWVKWQATASEANAASPWEIRQCGVLRCGGRGSPLYVAKWQSGPEAPRPPAPPLETASGPKPPGASRPAVPVPKSAPPRRRAGRAAHRRISADARCLRAPSRGAYSQKRCVCGRAMQSIEPWVRLRLRQIVRPGRSEAQAARRRVGGSRFKVLCTA
jgi:hypothetical protein